MSDIARSAAITREVVSIPPSFPAETAWRILFGISLSLLALLIVSVTVLFARGPGIWGLDIPVAWGFAISNYIWWLGIGHAGTLISAMLLLLNQNWRNALNRFAEAMTLFAVTCGGLYPILHLGRPWFFYWMAPYPSTMDVWPQFKSPLTWDFFAVLTYLIVSILFWYIGIIPDLAAARDRAKKRRWQIFFGLFSLGWRGEATHWARWRQAYALTAAIAVPLVVSVHSEISLLLAAGPVPGWNSTVFPPYFVLGAAFSGFAIVSMIAVGLRHLLGLGNIVTERHLNMLGILTLACGMMTAYGYFTELFTASYSGGFELDTLRDQLHGYYAWSYWAAVILNFVPIQLLWIRRIRTRPIPLFLIGLSVAIGMWMERYMLLMTGLYRDWLESSVNYFHASFWDWSVYLGTIGLFLTLFFLFVRFLPVVSQFEVKEEMWEEEGEGKGKGRKPAPPERLEAGEGEPYALLAEFHSPAALAEAAGTLREAGWERMEAYSPFPIPELREKLGFREQAVPLATLIGGIVGALTGFLMQVYTNHDFPLDIGGRSPVAPQAFVLITFELTVLFAILSGIGTMLILNRLPRLHHPLFESERFRAVSDRLFMLALFAGPDFDQTTAEAELTALGPFSLTLVRSEGGKP